jgi:hypothetical protein
MTHNVLISAEGGVRGLMSARLGSRATYAALGVCRTSPQFALFHNLIGYVSNKNKSKIILIGYIFREARQAARSLSDLAKNSPER